MKSLRLREILAGHQIFILGLVMLFGLASGCGTGVDPEGTGELSVSTLTSGPEPDADGYWLSLDGGVPEPMDPSGTTAIGNLAEGAHTVLITGIAANCEILGDNPRSVSVVADQTVQTTFSITCSSTTGSIEVITATSGEDPDDAYSISVDGEAPLSAAGSGTVSLPDLTEGQHTLELGGVAANCTVSGENPRAVSVTAGNTTTERFDVSCARAVGGLSIETLTAGLDLDPDGYVLVIDGGSEQAISINDTVFVSDLPVGSHEVELTGLAANCTSSGGNRRSVTVEFGVTAVDSFAVTCTQIPISGGMIVFHSDRDGDFEIYSMNADGSNVVQLTDNSVEDLFPAISPDGQFIAFASKRDGSIDLYIMEANGSNATQITNSGSADRDPAWSPDGSRLAFARASDDIYTIRVDGTELTRLTNTPFHDVEPAWSPDGLKIAFTTDRDGADEIYTMNALDGSDLKNLTNHPGRDDDADWSPDGSLILFHRNDSAVDGSWLGDGEIMCMAADGSGAIRMTTDTSGIVDWKPRWAPDGSSYVFTSNRDEGASGNELYTANANGCTSPPTSVNRVTQSPGKDELPDWSP